MNILDYSWGLVTSVGKRDYDSFRLILDKGLTTPALTADKSGMVLKLPVPRLDDKGFYNLQGLYFDADEQAWSGLWKLYRASLYHGALHSAYSDFKQYAGWAKGKDLKAATFVVSLIEDFRVTKKALDDWPGILPDIAYANYTSGLRIRNVDDIVGPERAATKLLLELWGVNHGLKGDVEEDTDVRRMAAQVRTGVEASLKGGTEYPKELFTAADFVYGKFARGSKLREVPSFPHTESHGESTIFSGQVVEADDPKPLELSALAALGLNEPPAAQEDTEARDFFSSIRAAEAKYQKIREKYERHTSSTRLDGIEYPSGDYANFMRIRSSLSGPIRNIRDQLRQVKNVLDETAGHESGIVDTQAAMQVIASGEMRSDVFIREEPIHKNEAWAILLDASKSTSAFSHEVKGISTCLAEVVKDLIPVQSQWAMYSFNNSLQIIKDYEEGYTSETKARIGGIQQRNITLLPDAIKVAQKVLSEQAVDTKILVVASDGYPTGYSGIEEELVSTIKAVSKSGTFLMGLGIDSHAIEEYFTVNCVVNSPYQMMKSFVKSYLEMSSLF
ncbi:MAG: hypothetical protein KGI38_10800 [Thaumarchaeota archaeon]|nr:hypothetical protein [Nitrososphaerota archaeon]